MHIKNLFIFLFLFVSSCVSDEPADVRKLWLSPQPAPQVLQNYMDSDVICMKLQDDGVLFIHTEDKDEFLDYTFDGETYDIQFIGKVTFYNITSNTYSANFENILIDNVSKDVVFVHCEPW